MERQTSNIHIKVDKILKEKIEKAAAAVGLKVGPYIKMVLINQIDKNNKDA